MSSDWSLPFRFSGQNFARISHLSHAFYMTRSSHPPWFDFHNNIWWSVQHIQLLTIGIHSNGQEILRLQFSLQSPPLDPTLRQFNPIHIQYRVEIHFNFVFPLNETRHLGLSNVDSDRVPREYSSKNQVVVV